ncbi:MAG TPA: hypothetical protein VFG61_02125 [Gaiellaceae bacterium]|nr:hypothetical protein [Gaiellaceae bacterium]
MRSILLLVVVVMALSAVACSDQESVTREVQARLGLDQVQCADTDSAFTCDVEYDGKIVLRDCLVSSRGADQISAISDCTRISRSTRIPQAWSSVERIFAAQNLVPRVAFPTDPERRALFEARIVVSDHQGLPMIDALVMKEAPVQTDVSSPEAVANLFYGHPNAAAQEYLSEGRVVIGGRVVIWFVPSQTKNVSRLQAQLASVA